MLPPELDTAGNQQMRENIIPAVANSRNSHMKIRLESGFRAIFTHMQSEPAGVALLSLGG